MKHSNHAEDITNRFREIVEEAGDIISPEHYSELSLLIEAGIDTAVVEKIEKIAHDMENMAHKLRHDAEYFV